jgi:hypothetical protein
MDSIALSFVKATSVRGVGTPAPASARLHSALSAHTAAVSGPFTTGIP